VEVKTPNCSPTVHRQEGPESERMKYLVVEVAIEDVYSVM
jgi:hypothetical protein